MPLSLYELALINATSAQAQTLFRAGYGRGLEALRNGTERDPEVGFPIKVTLDLNPVIDGEPLTPWDCQKFEDAGYQAARALRRKDHEALLFNPRVNADTAFNERVLTWRIDYLVQL